MSAGDAEPEYLAYARLLANVDLFSGLDRIALAKLAARLEPLAFGEQSEIFAYGSPGDAFYLVARGRVGVYVPSQSASGELRVRSLGPGEPFGEMALLTGESRTASIRCEELAQVLRLERSAFLELVKQEPSVALAMAATVSRRLAAMLRARSETGASAAKQRSTAPDAPAAIAARLPVSRLPLRSGTRPHPILLSAVVAAGLLAAAWLVLPTAGLPPAGWLVLATLLAALPVFVLEALPEGVVALGLAGAWVLLGTVTPDVALGGFATESWVLMVSVLVVAAAITTSGLLYRLALWMITRIGQGFPGQVLALTVAGVLISPAVPVATGRVAIVAPMLKELVEALGYRPQSSAAAGLSMAAFVGFGQILALFLTGSGTTVLVAAILPGHGGSEVSWISWLALAAPANLLLVVGLMLVIIWSFRPRGERELPPDAQKRSLALQHAVLGPPSAQEKISLVVAIGMLLGFVTQPLHGVHPAWVGVTAMLLLAAAGLVTGRMLRAINWSFALMFAVLISLADVFQATRIDIWIAQALAGVVGALAGTPILFVVVLALFSFGVGLLIRWQAAAPLITIALAPVAAVHGIDPFVVALVAMMACNGFILPQQNTTYLALYVGTEGKLFTHRQIMPVAIAYSVLMLIALCASVPYWQMMGLF